jgi:DNA-directed RNA polymerase specialized sigma24 family protein
MIRDMLESLEKALAQGMTRDEARQAAEIAVRQKYAGERVYVAALPKQRRAVQIAKLTLRSSREIAAATGLPLRTVQRLRSGR